MMGGMQGRGAGGGGGVRRVRREGVGMNEG